MAEGDIWWVPVCGNSSNDAFWSYSLTVNTTNPDFTRCFQDTVLVWGVCGLLWFSTPFYLLYLSNRRTLHPWMAASKLNISKLVMAFLLMLVSVAQLVNETTQHPDDPPSTWIAYFVYIATFLFAAFLMRAEYRRGEVSSGLLFCFWLLTMLVNIVPLRTRIMTAQNGPISDMADFVLFIIFFIMLVVQLTLHMFADPSALYPHQGVEKAGEKEPLLPHKSSLPPQCPKRQTTAPPCPELTAPFWSRMLFVWVSGLLVSGYKRALDGTGLWALRPRDTSLKVIARFSGCWKRSSRNHSQEETAVDEDAPGETPRRSYTAPQEDRTLLDTWKLNSYLLGALWRCYGFDFSLLAFYEVANIALTFIRPTLLDYLIGFVEGGDPLVWRGYMYAGLLLGITLLRAIVNQQPFYGKLVIGQRIRSAMTAAIYRKSLMLAASERKKYSVGEIVNLMSVDAQRLADAVFFLHNLWVAPVNIIVAMVMLWGYLGPSSLAGLALLILIMILNVFLASKMKHLQVLQMKFKDSRLKLTNEVLNGIKVLKLYAWEGAFEKKLGSIRAIEISYILKAAFYIAGTVVSMACAPVLYTVASFTIYIMVSSSSVLSAQVAFVSLSLVNSLTRPLAFLPNGIANIVQALVSLRRIENFMNGEELDPDAVTHKISENAIEVEHGTFSWDADETLRPTLRDVEVRLKAGSLTAVVGQVGSGKSSLLSAMLGEMHRSPEARVNTTGTMAFVPQEAWIRNQTLRTNVLFGTTMDQGKYDKVLDACALLPDLKILPGGDLTEIGEKGINLSGGQKQRVSLARAVYLDQNVYLLDDPLSAVDAHVGKHIFEKVIGPEGLLRNKTRVLVTHGLTYLPKVDHVIVLKDGRVSEQGTYQDLLNEEGGAFAELVRTYLTENSDEDDLDPEAQKIREELRRQVSTLSEHGQSSLSESEHLTRSGAARRRKRSKADRQSSTAPSDDERPAEKEKKGRRLVEIEDSMQGGVNFGVLSSYLRSMGTIATVLTMITFVVQSGCELGANIWLSEWSKDSSRNTSDPNLASVRVGVYGGIGLGQTLGTLGHTVALAVACTTAARIMHERLLNAIVKAPMAFFDTTPTGRILNRFSQDMNTVDAQIRFTIMAMLRGISGLLTTLIAICYTTPFFLAMILPLSIGYYFLQRFYVMSSNQLRRLVSVRTSPIYSHFGESVMGASSIRAYRRQEDFTEEADYLLDTMQESRYPSIYISRWLSIWLEALGGVTVLFTALYAVIARDSISGGLVGLSVSYSLQVTDRLAFFVRNMSDLEANVVAVERIEEYSKTTPEAPWEIPDSRPPTDWPQDGHVTFHDYSTRYRPGLELVLENLACSIKAAEKVGIVGRTGAGKSSMTLGLFRIIEPAGGTIVIDDVTTSSIGLHDLRTKLTIIPQDPVLFSGTLRFNLDPFDQYTDEYLWDALGHAHLKDFVQSVPAQLDYECGEGGFNLSVGQRQLVCLARALLRRTKILILDEATAAVDLETDDLIQNTIKAEFQECTVITIAHRINTVVDYDRIMVLDRGKIHEYDTPAKLLGDKTSMFYNMCKDAGIV